MASPDTAGPDVAQHHAPVAAATAVWTRVARVVTELCSPAVVVVLLPVLVAWHATAGALWQALGWGLLVAVFSSVLPMVFIVAGARAGRWDGHHVRDRQDRARPMLACLGCTVAGMVVLVLAGAPVDMIALDIAMVATLMLCMLITRWWKVSLHTTVLAGAVAMVALLYGAAWLPLVALVAVTGWSRVRLSDHTVSQVVAGALLGPSFGGVIFLLAS